MWVRVGGVMSWAVVALAACAQQGNIDGDVETQVVAMRDPERYRALAERIGADLAASGVPGGALAIVEGGRLVFATGLGVKDVDTGEPVRAETVFRVASTTKTFTAAAVMSLAEDRALSLDAPITRYAHELRLLPPNDPSRLTVRMLLSHTAGVPDYAEIECAEGAGALGAWFAAHPNLALWSPPGRLWSYSNLGFSLAGHVAARAAGAELRDLVEDRVLAPLGMDTATFDVDEVIAHGDYAVAHPGAPLPGLPPDGATLTRCALLEPAGYLYASALDMARFTEAVLAWGEGALSPLSLVQMALPHASTQAPPDALYGLGLIERPYQDKLLVGHPGDLFGMHSAWWLVPEDRFGVIVLVNGDGYPPTRAALQVIDELLAPSPVPPRDGATPPLDWWRYVGTYDGRLPEGAFPPGGLGLVRVDLEDGHLYATTLEDGARFELFQLARDAFYAPVDDTAVVLTFWRDRWGRAEYVATRIGHARRVGGRPASIAAARAGGENVFERIAREHPGDPLGWPALDR